MSPSVPSPFLSGVWLDGLPSFGEVREGIGTCIGLTEAYALL
jgi:hypothetical protein